MPKVLMLSPLPPPAGGIASWTNHLMKDGLPEGWEIKLVDTRVIGRSGSTAAQLNILNEFKRSLGIFRNLKKAMTDPEVKVVHLNTPLGSKGVVRDLLIASRVCRSGLPLLVHFRCNVEDAFNAMSWPAKAAFRRLVKMADLVIVLNQGSYSFVRLYRPENTIELLPNFIGNAQLLTKDDKRMDGPINRVLYVGAISSAKGSDLLFQAAERLPHLSFALVGVIGDDMAVKSRHLPPNVRLTGEISSDKVANEFRQADLFVFPSLTEGFPNAILEAMAWGLPIVASPVGAIPDMIETQGGILLQSISSEQIVQAILKIENNSLAAKGLGDWNRQKAQREYSYAKVTNKLVEYYKRLYILYNGKNVLLISPLPPPIGGIAAWTEKVKDIGMPDGFSPVILNSRIHGKRGVFDTRIFIVDEVIRSFRIITDLLKILQKKKISIVQINSPCGKFGMIRDVFCMLIVKSVRLPIIVDFHCDVFDKVDHLRWPFMFWFRSMVRLADRIIVLSQASCDYISNVCDRESVILPNFIGDEQVDKNRKVNTLRKKIQVVLFVGAVTKVKGCDTIIQIAEKFAEIDFCLIGSVYEDISQLPNIPPNVKFLGEKSNAEVHLAMGKSDLFLFPSLSEGFPLVILEAMSFGLPIVASRVGAIPDILEDGQGGVLIDKGSVEQGIQAMYMLQHDFERRSRMAVFNLTRINQYLYSRVIRELTTQYQDLIEKPQRRSGHGI